MRKNKKGSIPDIPLIMTVLIIFAITVLVVFKVSDEINTKFQNSTDINEDGKRAMNQINNMYPSVIDNSFLLLTIILSIAALTLAMLVRFHPIFFVPFFIVVIVIIFVAGIFSNIYLEMANKAEFTGVASQLTFITHIIAKLPIIIGIISFILSVVMYKMWSADQ